jgi:hypothetical protein
VCRGKEIVVFHQKLKTISHIITVKFWPATIGLCVEVNGLEEVELFRQGSR